MYPQRNTDLRFKPIDSIYEDRLRQFTNTSGQYHDLNLPKFYTKARLVNIDKPKDKAKQKEGYLQMRHWPAPGLTKPLFHTVIPSKLDEFKLFHAGQSFGPPWSSHWFQITFRLPKSFLNEERVILKWDAGCEGMVFDHTGLPLQGIMGDGERNEFIVPPEWYADGKEYIFYIECGCNGMFGSPKPSFSHSLVEFQVPNLDALALYYDFWILSDAAREDSAPQKHKARQVCNSIMDAFDPEDVGSIKVCRQIAAEFLGPNVDSEKVYQTKLPEVNAVYAIGNCHIDTAWLWDWATTRTKIARSWSSQLRLIEEYPEYVFVASAGIHFKWLIQDYPDLWKKLQKAVKGGRFIPLGGAWVENDTNIPTGEGIARQFILGQRYYQHIFGFKSDIYWLPDSFGYSTQVPQLCRLAGMPNFLTQKLSWNNIDSFPNSSFNWIGIDNSQVLVHMPPDNTYTAEAHFGDVKRSVQQHKNLYNDQKGMLLYGKGDGGGGPKAEMIEKLRRIRGYADTAGGLMPKVEVGCTVDDFYKKLRKDTHEGRDLPDWKGELYLEYHRGTYTTQAKMKNFMRTTELLAHDLETIAATASIVNKSYKYPHGAIEQIWEDICLCQFHDVIPGSCIEKVYHEEAWPLMESVIAREQKLIKKALKVIGLEEAGSSSAKSDSIVKFNALPWSRTEVLPVESVPAAVKAYSQSDKYVFFSGAKYMLPVASKPRYPASVTFKDGAYTLTNGRLSASIDSDGIVRSLIDLGNGREVIDTTTHVGGNQYVMYSDTPLNFQAWDTELFSLGKYKLVDASEIRIVEEGPLVASLEVTYHVSATSTLKTIISLEAGDNLDLPSSLKFDCSIDWDEKYKFLKVQFPVTISADIANYETQFGLTQRPTTYNTTWEIAKFECCCHKFVDFSDFNYGVSLLNNNKYGANVHGNMMTLSLLRAPKYPDPTADIGKHTFSYAILPHKGALSAQTVRAGWEFNDRLNKPFHLSLNAEQEAMQTASELVRIVGDDNLILSNIKRGEDDFDVDDEGASSKLPKKHVGSQTLVLRVYESLGGISEATIKLFVPVKKVFKTNLLEEPIEEVPIVDNSFKLKSRAFEVSTYQLVLA